MDTEVSQRLAAPTTRLVTTYIIWAARLGTGVGGEGEKLSRD